MRLNTKIVIAVGASFAINVVTTCILMSWKDREIVSFNMKETVDTFSRQVIAQKHSDEEVKRLTEKFNAALSKSVAEYAGKHNAVVLVRPAVVEGVKDVTTDLQNEIAIQMQGQGR